MLQALYFSIQSSSTNELAGEDQAGPSRQKRDASLHKHRTTVVSRGASWDADGPRTAEVRLVPVLQPRTEIRGFGDGHKLKTGLEKKKKTADSGRKGSAAV